MEDKLRAEFQKFVESSMWEGDNEFTRNMLIEHVTEWWLYAMAEYKTNLRALLERKIKDVENANAREPLKGVTIAAFQRILDDELLK